jgi:hypothetical protein
MSEGMMKDAINAYFRQFYPEDFQDKWEASWCGNFCARRYTGASSTIFPRIICADGFTISVQGHFGAYSHPRDDFSEYGYSHVEVLCPPDSDLGEKGERCGDEQLYGYVPVDRALAVIAKHGGWADALIPARKQEPGK